MSLLWRRSTRSDDMGGNARREEVWIAHDGAECEWLIAPHGDGSWNWTRSDATGDLIDMGVDHPSAEAAKASAEARAMETALPLAR